MGIEDYSLEKECVLVMYKQTLPLAWNFKDFKDFPEISKDFK